LIRSLIAPLAERLPLPVAETHRRLLYALQQGNEVDQLLSIYTIISPATRAHLLRPETRKQLDSELPRTFVASQLKQAPPGTRLERMLHVDTRTSLADNLLLCEDKMSMAASVEARVPFLDLEFMALAERIPGRLKVRWGSGKYVHKRMCSGTIPERVIRRPKIGFTSAVDIWLRGRLGQRLRAAIDAPDSLTKTYLNPVAVAHLLNEHDSGRRNHQRILFLLLSMEAWYRTFAVR
jgi:asparagine synthase (glutamine-hydrolysing)